MIDADNLETTVIVNFGELNDIANDLNRAHGIVMAKANEQGSFPNKIQVENRSFSAEWILKAAQAIHDFITENNLKDEIINNETKVDFESDAALDLTGLFEPKKEWSETYTLTLPFAALRTMLDLTVHLGLIRNGEIGDLL